MLLCTLLAGGWGFPPGEAPVTRWQAQWIWLPVVEDADMLLARKAFTLADVPRRVSLSITASSRYQLFINGKYICSGPARCAPHHQSFDVLDVTQALHEGENVLAVRVHHQRDAVSYYGVSRAGLLAQLDGDSAVHGPIVKTDATWRVMPDIRWQNASPRIARFHLEVCDRMDLRQSIGVWTDTDFDAGRWHKARVLARDSGWPLPPKNDRPSHLIPPWTSLVARDIPYLIETPSGAQRPIHASSVSASQIDPESDNGTWISAPSIDRISISPNSGPLTKTSSANPRDATRPTVVRANLPGECRVLVYDMGQVHNGRPYLDIEAPAGTVVDVMAAPYLIEGNLPSPIVASTLVDRIVLSGKRDRWTAFYTKPIRWLAIVFRRLTGDARLHGVGVVRAEYPFEQQGFFRVPDYPELEAFWQASAKTIRVCTTDAYTDNYRERRQYAQTSYYACLGNYPVFGDHALQGRYLRQIAEEQLANGIMPAYAPRHGDDFMVILDSNCFWVRGLHQYLLYSGDRAATRELLPNARKLLELLHSFTNSDGLIDSPPYPYWLDHAVNDRRGANFCLNGHYLGALEDFAQVLEWLDQPDAGTYRQRAQRIRRALRDQLWDPHRRLFADALVHGTRSGMFSEQANALALALRIGSPDQTQAVAAELSSAEDHDFIHRRSGLVMVTPAMSYFLHAGLCEAGHADASWDLLRRRFAHMLGPGTNGTLWEEWWLDGSGRSGVFKKIASGRSDAQTESAFFPGLFARYILGIDPTQPGLRDVVLRYYRSSRLLRRRGAIPTPTGLLEVAWEVSPAEFQIKLKIPPGTTLRIDSASLGSPPSDRVTINNRPLVRNQVEHGMWSLSPGESIVRVERK